MSPNKLKLNLDKTEFLLIENERQRSKYLSMFPIELLGAETFPAKCVRNIGVIFDKNLNFRSHISAICSLCIYHIRDLRSVHRHFDLDSAKLFANALVSSRLDCCNSLLSAIAETDLPNSNVFGTVWHMWSQSHHHLLAVFHCCAPFIGYQ